MSSFCSAKATHIFSTKNIRILYIESVVCHLEHQMPYEIESDLKRKTLFSTGSKSFDRIAFAECISIEVKIVSHRGANCYCPAGTQRSERCINVDATATLHQRQCNVIITTCQRQRESTH